MRQSKKVINKRNQNLIDQGAPDISSNDKKPFIVELVNRKESKWRDPNTYIAALTFLTLIFSIIALRVTNSQWKKINAARISISKAQFYTFRTIDWNSPIADSVEGTQMVGEDMDSPNYMMIKYLIAAYKNSNVEPIPGAYGLTLLQCINQLNKRNIKIDSSILFRRLFKLEFTIQNVAQTSCIVDSIVTQNFHLYESPNYKSHNYDPVTAPQKNFTLEPSEKFIFTSTTFAFALGDEVPNFDFDLNVFFHNSENESSAKKVFIQYINNQFLISNQK